MTKIRNQIPPSESRIFFNGVELSSPIPNTEASAIADLGDRMVVIFCYPNFTYSNLPAANAFAFDRSGKIIWTVQPIGPPEDVRDPYMIFQLAPESGQLFLGTCDGYRVALNVENGSIEIMPVGRAW